MRKILTTVMTLLLITNGAFAAELADNGNGTVTDGATTLMWQQGEGGRKKWIDAVGYCSNISLGGHDDWRLPTISELKTLAEEHLGYPKIETKYFPDFPATHVNYWSSTETIGNALKAKGLVFTYGKERDFVKEIKYRVRCVRRLQKGGG